MEHCPCRADGRYRDSWLVHWQAAGRHPGIVRSAHRHHIGRSVIGTGPGVPDELRSDCGNHRPRTVADVERDLILETLKHCLGNRTHAANILGISIRTLRNKLNEYAAGGAPIPPANGGGEQMRGAA